MGKIIVCIAALFSFASCMMRMHEIAVVNSNGLCEDFVLYNHVSNKLSIVIENKTCKSVVWRIQGGELAYTGGCDYVVIPRIADSDSNLLHLRTRGKELEFFVIDPPFTICIGNFGCQGRENAHMYFVKIISIFPDLQFVDIEYDLEIFREGVLVYQKNTRGFVFPEPAQKTIQGLQKGDYIILRDVIMSTAHGYEIKQDSIVNYYARHAFH